MMIFNGLVFQYNHLCDVSEYSNWRLYKFFNKTVKLTTGFKNWISTHDFLMDELSSKRSQKSPRNIPIRVNIVAQFYITGVSFLAGTGMTTGGISTRGIFVNRDYIRWSKQFNPSPENPFLQEHSNDSKVFSQLPFEWHDWSWYSLIAWQAWPVPLKPV